MKKILGMVFLAITLGAGWYGWSYLATKISPCDNPIPYHLGQVDSRFEITNAKAAQDVDEAIHIWDKASGKNLFTESSVSALTVNFVYDERQALSSKIGSMENNLGVDKKALDAEVAAFTSAKTDYENKVNALNSEIDSWNKRGGAPPDVYQQLIQKQQDLQNQRVKLQQQADALNSKTTGYNFSVGQLNSTIDNFNTAMGQKPEEGLFDGKSNTIYIYLVSTHEELVHTLAHEFGHALGMGHVDDPNAIMYPYTDEKLVPTVSDISALGKICVPVSRWETLKSNAIFFWQGKLVDLQNQLVLQR